MQFPELFRYLYVFFRYWIPFYQISIHVNGIKFFIVLTVFPIPVALLLATHVRFTQMYCKGRGRDLNRSIGSRCVSRIKSVCSSVTGNLSEVTPSGTSSGPFGKLFGLEITCVVSLLTVFLKITWSSCLTFRNALNYGIWYRISPRFFIWRHQCLHGLIQMWFAKSSVM